MLVNQSNELPCVDAICGMMWHFFMWLYLPSRGFGYTWFAVGNIWVGFVVVVAGPCSNALWFSMCVCLRMCRFFSHRGGDSLEDDAQSQQSHDLSVESRSPPSIVTPRGSFRRVGSPAHLGHNSKINHRLESKAAKAECTSLLVRDFTSTNLPPSHT